MPAPSATVAMAVTVRTRTRTLAILVKREGTGEGDSVSAVLRPSQVRLHFSCVPAVCYQLGTLPMQISWAERTVTAAC